MKKNIGILLGLCFSLFFLINCSTSEEVPTEVIGPGDPGEQQQQTQAPSLRIDSVSETENSATVTVTILDDGGDPITAKGVVWNDTGDPAIDDNPVTVGGGSSSFTADITGLTPNTNYFVRAFATNSVGLTLTAELSFQTAEETTTGNVFVGNVIFQRQSEVDAFGANNYTEITGRISIQDNGTDPIVDLTPLSTVTKVFALSFMNATELVTLDGLHNISILENEIQLANMTSLETLADLNFEPAVFFALGITNCPLLTNLEGLEPIMEVEGPLALRDLSALEDLTALQNIKKVGWLGLDNNPLLTNLNGLAIEEIDDRLYLEDMQGLTDISALSSLTLLQAEIRIINTPQLTDISALSAVETAGELILEDTGLTDLSGLENLTSILEDLRIRSNSSLRDFCALQTLFINDGLQGAYVVEDNAFNPTAAQIEAGDCSQ